MANPDFVKARALNALVTSPSHRGTETALAYPLVICYVAIEHDHRNSGFSHEKW